jgi:hypothetical protein
MIGSVMKIIIMPSRRKILSAAACTALVLVSGCASPKKCSGFYPSISATNIARNGTIRISIDGSDSMRGFAIPKDSEFRTTLTEMDLLLGDKGVLMENSSPNIFRLGRLRDKKVSMIPIPSLRLARSADFYRDSTSKWPAVTSSIDQFATPSKESIDILVSDLEPDEASIKGLINSVTPKLISTQAKKTWFQFSRRQDIPTELVLVGIKSKFSDKVFPSAAGQLPPFPFKGKRPFYILILGDTTKVEIILSRLLKNLDFIPQIQITRFAANPDYGYTVFVDKKQTELKPESCLMSVFSHSRGPFKIRLDHNERWILAKTRPNCKNTNVSVPFKITSSLGFKLNIPNIAQIFDDSVPVSNYSIKDVGFSVDANLNLQPSSLSYVNSWLVNSEVDSVIWRNWSSDSMVPDGTKTQQLMRLIRGFREMTDNYAQKNYNQKYSTLRLCGIVRS